MCHQLCGPCLLPFLVCTCGKEWRTILDRTLRFRNPRAPSSYTHDTHTHTHPHVPHSTSFAQSRCTSCAITGSRGRKNDAAIPNNGCAVDCSGARKTICCMVASSQVQAADRCSVAVAKMYLRAECVQIHVLVSCSTFSAGYFVLSTRTP